MYEQGHVKMVTPPYYIKKAPDDYIILKAGYIIIRFLDTE
jgi:hypothetical protein